LFADLEPPGGVGVHQLVGAQQLVQLHATKDRS